ncbi:MAG TPA: hypothetical protein VD963_07805 [Phycisphaerales bacterium]|nr:hypothetical protein [Phycisphaerales bacterium]
MSAAEPSRAAPPTARARRAQHALRTGAVFLAITASCLFAGILAHHWSARFDATQAGEHRLAPRTRGLLDRLTGPCRVIIAAPAAGTDPRARQRALDVLAAMERHSPHVRGTVIDTGSARGREEFEQLLAELVGAYRPELERAAAAVTVARTAAGELARACESLGTELLGMRAALAGLEGPVPAAVRDYAQAQAGLLRVKADDLLRAGRRAEELLAQSAGPVAVPGTDHAALALRTALAETADLLGELERNLSAIASPAAEVPGAVRDSAAALVKDLPGLRDRAVRVAGQLGALEHPPVLGVARAIERSSAALVLGPPAERGAVRPGRAMAAVSTDLLFPPVGTESQGASQRFRAEELLATAIGTIANPEPPIVVFVHGAPAPMAAGMPMMSVLVDRLRLRGVTVLDWAPAHDPDPPALGRVDPRGERPVVYVSISTSADSPAGATRMARLADALARLADEGRPLLLSVTPSLLPAGGAPDPMVAFLERWGLRADSGRPLVQQFTAPGGRVVTGEHLVHEPGSDHRIAGAINGLGLFLLWPIPLEPLGAPGAGPVAISPLVTLPARDGLWAEAEWMALRAGRAGPGAQPTPDGARDDVTGPWTVAAALERPVPESGGASGASAAPRAQRLVVVGSNGWFFDAVTQQQAEVEGRIVFAAPANLELFEAAVSWLAGQDELIAPSPAATVVPLIPPMSPGTLALLRWGVGLGLPVLVLLAGAAWRLIFG